MAKSAQPSHDISVIGMSMAGDRMELHGVNNRGDVLLQGWFSPPAGMSLLCTTAPCAIALDDGATPEAVAESLEAMGFTAILVAAATGRGRFKTRSASDLVRLAIDVQRQVELAGLAEQLVPSTTMPAMMM